MSDFQKDLEFGQLAEARFNILWPALTRTDGRKGDFTLPDGSIVELKTDKYNPCVFPNVIMERYRSGGLPGGPWQAQEHGAKYFSYWFIKWNILKLYHVDTLVQVIPDIVSKRDIGLSQISNGSYATSYYRVPIVALTDFELRHNILQGVYE
jgi:hypothetical protein